ncbi:MAG: hypothetical protein H0X13_04275 [Ramlibacter sp.]|nr:hypothetical protein [Ramlibacter sp.]
MNTSVPLGVIVVSPVAESSPVRAASLPAAQPLMAPQQPNTTAMGASQLAAPSASSSPTGIATGEREPLDNLSNNPPAGPLRAPRAF